MFETALTYEMIKRSQGFRFTKPQSGFQQTVLKPQGRLSEADNFAPYCLIGEHCFKNFFPTSLHIVSAMQFHYFVCLSHVQSC